MVCLYYTSLLYINNHRNEICYIVANLVIKVILTQISTLSYQYVSKMRLYIYVMKSTGGKLQRTQVQFNLNKHKTKELRGMNLDQDLNKETLHKYGQT